MPFPLAVKKANKNQWFPAKMSSNGATVDFQESFPVSNSSSLVSLLKDSVGTGIRISKCGVLVSGCGRDIGV